jgi:hypothetical protein
MVACEDCDEDQFIDTTITQYRYRDHTSSSYILPDQFPPSTHNRPPHLKHSNMSDVDYSREIQATLLSLFSIMNQFCAGVISTAPKGEPFDCTSNFRDCFQVSALLNPPAYKLSI